MKKLLFRSTKNNKRFNSFLVHFFIYRRICVRQTNAPFALKRTGKLSHSLRHKKSRGFKRDFLWV